jgi:hypothetical protein
LELSLKAEIISKAIWFWFFAIFTGSNIRFRYIQCSFFWTLYWKITNQSWNFGSEF